MRYLEALELLGLQHSSTVLAEAKVSYRKLCLKFHPDKNIDNKAEATVKFQELTNAYETIVKQSSNNGADAYYDDDDMEDDSHNFHASNFEAVFMEQMFREVRLSYTSNSHRFAVDIV